MKLLQTLRLGKVVSLTLRGCAATMLCAVLANPALAWDYGSNHSQGHQFTPHHQPSCGGSGGSVPEIDPNSLYGALTLLGGGVLVLTDRFRKK